MPTAMRTHSLDLLSTTLAVSSHVGHDTAHDVRPLLRSEGTFTWTLLGRLDAFLNAWQGADSPPALADYLPPGPREASREALVQFLLADLEYRYRRGWPKRVEEYAEEFPELAEGGIPCELIFEEFHIRRTYGEKVDPEEYYRRFPDQVEELEACFALAAPAETPTIMGGVMRVLDVNVGQTLDDFQLLSLLGEGAFGRVFLARQNSMQRLVALKVSGDRGAEPETLAQLDHPNIVRVYDQRRMPERGLRLLYMQYVAGGTLQDVVRRVRETPVKDRRGSLLLKVVDEAVERGGQPAVSFSTERRRLAAASWPEVVCRLGAQLAQALDYAHRCGVLHRDVKPANVLLAADGSPKLADFNISANSALDDTPCKAYFGGSLAYMSPEQLEACHPRLPTQPDDLNEWSDIYSLGVLLWELLHGERPFADQMHEDGFEPTIEAMIAARRAGLPPSAVSDDPLLAVLDDILRRCLAPNPGDRFPSAQRLARELRLCLNARAREILLAPPRGWRRLAQRHPLMAGMVVGYASHAVVAVFAAVYIYYAIIAKQPPAQQEFWYGFLAALAALGAVAGVAAVWIFGRKVVRAIKSPLGQSHHPKYMADVRREALNLAPRAALAAVHNWTVSGVLYVVVQWLISAELGMADCLNIIGSHVICGCLALVYPVLGGALVSIRAYYPALVARTPEDPNDGAELALLAKRIALVVPFAGFIPMFAISWFALGMDDLSGGPRVIAVLFLGVAGLLAIPLAWAMSRAIQADLAALIRATSGDEPNAHEFQRESRLWT